MGSNSALVSKQLYALYFALPICHEQTFSFRAIWMRERQKYLENLGLKSSDKEADPLPPEDWGQLLIIFEVEDDT